MTSRKRTNANIDRIRVQIRKFVHEGIPDKEIIDTLAIPRRTFYTYKKKIIEQDKKLWREITSEYLASELLRLRSSLEETFTKSRELANTPGLDVGDVLAALNSQYSARLSILQLLVEGTQLLTEEENQKQQNKYHKSQSKIMMQAEKQPHP